jgi:hypothetical protein
MKTNPTLFARMLGMALLAFGLTPIPCAAIVLDVPQCYQEKDQWCWAGSSQAVLAFYGANVAQTNIAQYGTGGSNTWNYLYGSGTESGVFRRGVDLILGNFAGITSTGTNNLVSLDGVQNEINTNKRPMVIRWLWDSGGGHILVMYGVAISTNCPICFTNIWLMDPLNGPTVNSYAWVCRGGGHTWTHTLPISTPAPALEDTPFELDFGVVEVGSSADRNFIIGNAGGGWLVGTSSVAPPFSIVSGASYRIPSLSGQMGTVRYSPTAPGTNTDTVAFTGGGGGSCTATGIGSLLLEEALDAPYLTFVANPASGGPFWELETNITHDGVSAAGSGRIVLPQQTWGFSTTVTGPGVVSFWWQMWSMTGLSFMGFDVSGAEQAVISSTMSWNLYAAVVPSGSQSLEWAVGTYQTQPPFFDEGWVDQVTFGPAVAVAWGGNGRGQINVPAGLTNVVAVAGGGTYSMVLNDDGTVAGWNVDYNNAPAGLTNAVAIAAGESHNLALQANGRVVAWGLNTYGQTNVPPGLTNVVAVAGGLNHSLALNGDGTVVAWGDNSSSQTNVPPALSNVVTVAAGRFHSLALNRDGTVVAWGDNSSGQTNVPTGLTNIVAIAAGGWHNLALRGNGRVVAWGDNGVGQTNVPAGLTNVVAIAAAYGHSLALKADGTVVAWGYNTSGQTNVPVWLTNVVAVAGGDSHSLALMGGLGPAAGTLSLVNSTLRSNVFTISVPTVRGRAYFLEYKDSLADPRWMMRQPVPGDGTIRQLADPSATTAQRFYRVRQQ